MNNQKTFRTVEYLDKPFTKKFADPWTKPSEITSNFDFPYNYEFINLIMNLIYNNLLTN